MMKLFAKLPHDDTGAKLMRFEDIRGNRYTEIFLIGGNVFHLVGGIYNTIGLNSTNGAGDTCPQPVLDRVDSDAPQEQPHTMGAFKNGPRLWTVDWVEVMVGGERDFNGLKARWVMWLDVPKEMRKHEASPTGRSTASATPRSGSTPVRPSSCSTIRTATPGA
jgi:hypothetical protein